jgi:hypothetical protein
VKKVHEINTCILKDILIKIGGGPRGYMWKVEYFSHSRLLIMFLKFESKYEKPRSTGLSLNPPLKMTFIFKRRKTRL